MNTFSIDFNSIFNNKSSLVSDSSVCFFKFDSFPLIDEITQQSFMVGGDGSPKIEKAVFGNGLKLSPQNYYSFNFDLKNRSLLTISFWLKSVNYPPSVDAVTSLESNYTLSLFDKSDFYYDSSSEIISPINGSFVIIEECLSDNKNRMYIFLYGEDKNQSSFVSDPYLVGSFNNFIISYDGISDKVDFYINGLKSNLNIFKKWNSSRNSPDKLFNSFNSSFKVNYSSIGLNSNARKNTGIIDELLIINDYIIDSNEISKIINFGCEYLISDKLKFYEEFNCGFIFDTPPNVSCNSILDSSGYIYLCKSDGSIDRGYVKDWHLRRDFSNPQESKGLISKKLDKDSSVSVNNSGEIEIYKSRIKIG